MVLTCDGPDKLFDNHTLVLKVSYSDSKRVGVFCARGEWPGGASSHPALSSASHTLSFFSCPHLSLPSVTFRDSHHSHTVGTQRVTQGGSIARPLLQTENRGSDACIPCHKLTRPLGGGAGTQSRVCPAPKPLVFPLPPSPAHFPPLITGCLTSTVQAGRGLGAGGAGEAEAQARPRNCRAGDLINPSLRLEKMPVLTPEVLCSFSSMARGLSWPFFLPLRRPLFRLTQNLSFWLNRPGRNQNVPSGASTVGVRGRSLARKPPWYQDRRKASVRGAPMTGPSADKSVPGGTFPRGGREGAGRNHYIFFLANFTT